MPKFTPPVNEIPQKVRKVLRKWIKFCIVFWNHYAARKKSTLDGKSLRWFYWLLVGGKVGWFTYYEWELVAWGGEKFERKRRRHSGAWQNTSLPARQRFHLCARKEFLHLLPSDQSAHTCFGLKDFFWIRGDTFGIFQTEKVLSALLYVTLLNQKGFCWRCVCNVCNLSAPMCQAHNGFCVSFHFFLRHFLWAVSHKDITSAPAALSSQSPRWGPHHHHRQHHHGHDYHRSSSAKYLTKIFRRRWQAFSPSPLWRSATHKLLSHSSIFSFFHFFLHVYVYIPLLYTRILRVQISLLLSFYIFFH